MTSSDSPRERRRSLGLTPGALESGEIGTGPWKWIVTWGVPLRPRFHSEIIEAFDSEDALAQARELRPDLAPPRTAFLAAPERAD